MSNIFKDYKCPICNGTLKIHTKSEDFGHYCLPNPRLVCNHCKIQGGYAGAMLTEEQERERLIHNFEKAVASRKANDLKKPEKILTDIRDYLVTEKGRVANGDIYLLQIQAVEKFAEKSFDGITEYAEKLEVEL